MLNKVVNSINERSSSFLQLGDGCVDYFELIVHFLTGHNWIIHSWAVITTLSVGNTLVVLS